MTIIKDALAWLDSTARAKVLLDKTAWLLILPALATLFFLDPAAAKTLVQWSLYGVVLAGVVVVISRLIFPQIALGEFIASALKEKNAAAGIVVGAIVLFVAIMTLALVIWAKA